MKVKSKSIRNTPIWGTTSFTEERVPEKTLEGHPTQGVVGRRDFIQNFGMRGKRNLTGKQFSTRVNDAISFISEEMRRARKNKALMIITVKTSWSERTDSN